MAEVQGPNQPIAITLERCRWEQVLLCLDRYVNVLRGDFDHISDDVEWANQLDAMTDELRQLLDGSNNMHHAGPSNQVSEDVSPYDSPNRTAPSTSETGKPWTTDEITAVIDTYFWMLDEIDAGREVNKAATYRSLNAGPLPLRSVKSIERKMQNISMVLDRHGIPFVRGLKPLKSAQRELVVAVETLLAERGLIDSDVLTEH